MNQKIIKKIKKKIKNTNYEVYGLRSELYNNYELGDIAKKSYIWDDDQITDEQLPGTCTVRINQENIESGLKAALDYFGENILLLAGEEKINYEDADYREQLIPNAKIIGKYKYKDIEEGLK